VPQAVPAGAYGGHRAVLSRSKGARGERERDGVSVSTVERYLRRLTEAGRVLTGNGLYWLAEPAGDSAEETTKDERN
jgi:hypothetical protein